VRTKKQNWQEWYIGALLAAVIAVWGGIALLCLPAPALELRMSAVRSRCQPAAHLPPRRKPISLLVIASAYPAQAVVALAQSDPTVALCAHTYSANHNSKVVDHWIATLQVIDSLDGQA